MTLLNILAATLAVAALYVLFRCVFLYMAKKELVKLGAEMDGAEIVLRGIGVDSLEYALRCALLVADGRKTVVVCVSCQSAEWEEMMDMLSRFSLRHQNLRYQDIRR